MKLETLIEREGQKPGTYVGGKFDRKTVARLKKFAKDHNIPNYLESDKYHTTIIYSRKHIPDLDISNSLKDNWIGKPEKLEIFSTTGGGKALVLRYSCDEQKKLHQHIMDTTVATYDHPEYKIHVTLSYDIGDYDEDKLDNLPLDKLGELIIDKIYKEELNLDWASGTIKKKD
jgi:hypothetical protein